MSGNTKAALKQPVQRLARVRLDSIKRPQTRPVPQAIRQSSSQVRKPASLSCTNKQCPKSDVVEDDGKLVCQSCGVVVQDGQITSEIQFLDMANGSVAVQGSYVGANEEHARNSALGNSKIAGGMDSRQVTLRHGNNAIRQIADGLRLSDTHKARALSLYTLATGINFIQGREINHVAAVCLYIACRMETQNRMMLIDFSDALQVNVFKLGQTYLTLVQDLGLREKGGIGELNPEGLIYRFADELEFGSDTTKIAEEAVKILQRMQRDWMTPGRRPAGVCAAAIIIAARMNNYRRTVREIVYIAKVTDVTIANRLDEFKYTESSKLTVAEFLHHGDKLEKSTDPPAFYKQFLPKKNRRTGKVNGTAQDEMSETASQRAISIVSSRVSDRQNSPTPSQQDRTDTRAMPPPPVPIDPALLEVSAQRLSELETAQRANSPSESEANIVSTAPIGQKRKRGRPVGIKNRPPPTPTSTQILAENDMESEINSLLNNPETISAASALHKKLHPDDPASPPPTQRDRQSSVSPSEQSILEQAPSSSYIEERSDDVLESTEPDSRSRAQQGLEIDRSLKTTEQLLATIPDTEIIPEDEFADDPEVADCQLTEAEVTIKERIWVHENSDWLRQKQAKAIRAQLAEENGTARVIIRRKRKRGRMGDMSIYQKTGVDGQITGPQTPEEAVAAMLAKRAYSKKINYQAVHHLLGSENNSEPSSPSRASTPRFTITAPTPPLPGSKTARYAENAIDEDNDDDDDNEEEEEEETVEILGPVFDKRRTLESAGTDAMSVVGDEPDDLTALAHEAAEALESDDDVEYYEEEDYVAAGGDEDDDVDEGAGSGEE